MNISLMDLILASDALYRTDSILFENDAMDTQSSITSPQSR